MSDRQPAWTQWGLTYSGDVLTAEDAAKAAMLNDWNVRKQDLYVAGGIEVPNKMATVRDNPRTGQPEVLGVVGNRYVVVQNEDAFGMLTHIVDEGGAVFDSAGQNSTGSKVFMTLKMPEGIQIGGEDAHDLHLLASNSHDGSSSLTIAVVMNRLACQNAVTGALKGAQRSWSIRHTASAEGRIEEARQSLELTFKYVEEFEREMQELLARDLTEREWGGIVERLVPESKSEHEGWADRVAKQRADLNTLYFDAATQEFGRGTAYAALNAATEYADWYLPIKGADPDGRRRAERALFGPTAQNFKDKAARLIAA